MCDPQSLAEIDFIEFHFDGFAPDRKAEEDFIVLSQDLDLALESSRNDPGP